MIVCVELSTMSAGSVCLCGCRSTLCCECGCCGDCDACTVVCVMAMLVWGPGEVWLW